MGFDPKDTTYPCLLIDSNHPDIPCADLVSTKEIIGFLNKNGFIGDIKSHSAKEK
jgi:hypothetical protein